MSLGKRVEFLVGAATVLAVTAAFLLLVSIGRRRWTGLS